MIRIGAWIYRELPREETLAGLLGEAVFAYLAQNRRGTAERETLLGFALLSRILPEADLMAIKRTDEGRPYLAGRSDVDFNISHGRNLVVCAAEVENSPRVGIDAEALEGRTDDSMRRIAARWFSSNERKIWEQDPTEKRFLSIWTAKEAIVKWEGGGLRKLRATDSADADLPLILTTYPIGNAIVTLACGKGARPPKRSEIALFS